MLDRSEAEVYEHGTDEMGGLYLVFPITKYETLTGSMHVDG